MMPLELAAAAARALADPGRVGVVLTVQKGGLPQGFPRGELLDEMTRTYHFDPSKVIAWLLRNGLVEMERTGEGALSFREPCSCQGSEGPLDPDAMPLG